ncbi:MAG: 5'-nucleotidase C-terminal domain-containing protein [Microcoleus sp. CAN_BIN18]|nr:5'-nucleotidase C-terminal domain-containing protein [Microcoleus sp. CAN_BIN18]
MKKWDYLFLDANMYPFGNKLISLYVNGEELRDWKQGSLHLFVNQLGDEGWELVALRHDSKYDQNCLIFKRPKIVTKTRNTKESQVPKD